METETEGATLTSRCICVQRAEGYTLEGNHPNVNEGSICG